MGTELSALFQAGGLRPPRILTLAVTDDCNLNCSHCWVEARPQWTPVRVETRTIQRLIREFSALGGAGIRLTGGEPLLHPDWQLLVESACAAGLRPVEIQTNGLLLGEAEIAAMVRFAPAGLKLQISLDGATAVSHDRVRGVGAYAGALAGIHRLVAAGLAGSVSLFFTEMAHNLAEYPALLSLAAEAGVASVVSGTLVSGGRATKSRRVAPPEPHQYWELIHRFRSDARFRALYDRLGMMAALEWYRADSDEPTCCNLAESPYLTPEGRLYPCLLCHHDDFAVSGIFGRPLHDAWLEAVERWGALQQLARQRAGSIALCRTCSESSRCAGGCVGRAWGSRGDLLAPDDRCSVRRLIARQRRHGQ